MQKNKQPHEILRLILKDEGRNVLEDAARLNSLIDNCNIDVKTQLLFKYAIEDDVPMKLIELEEKNPSRRMTYANNIKYDFHENRLLQDDLADYAISCFMYALGWIEEVPLNPTEKAKLATKEEQETIPIIYNQHLPEMIFVEGGTFLMGSPADDEDRFDDEEQHQVVLESYYIGKYEVTFDEYDLYCTATGKEKPSDNDWGRGARPVINVSWNDAVGYCLWLNEQTGENYRLLTEAEWEYAARGGHKSQGYRYAGSNDIDLVAWYWYNGGNKTHFVGQKQPNELGIYDMSGNVWEWCNDWYRNYGSSAQVNPKISTSASVRVLRGGGWINFAQRCRIPCRSSYEPNGFFRYLGFRLARVC